MTQATEFVAVVPARLASTRLPNKPLADLAGKPLVVWAADVARLSGAARVVVATDSADIVSACQQHGFDALLTRSDHPTGTDRIAEVVDALALPDDMIVVNVQGDEPLMDPALVRRVAEQLAADPLAAIATAAHPMHTVAELLNPNFVKVVLNVHGRAAYFSRAPIPFARDAYRGDALANPAQATAHSALRHVGLYAYRADFLRRFTSMREAPTEKLECLEQLRALWYGETISVLVTHDAPAAGVDTPEDLERVRQILAVTHKAR